jgi:hypothetical protein
MRLYDSTDYGIDLLSEISLGRFLAGNLDDHGFYVVYRPDGTTAVNVISGYTWLDDPERHEVVRRSDYTDYRHQIPLPIVSYDFLSDNNISLELGSQTKVKNYVLSIIVTAENKAQVTNLAGYLSHMLEITEIPIENYNVDTYDKIGVLYSENIITTRDFNVFTETNIANYYSMAITCDMYAEYNNDFQLK